MLRPVSATDLTLEPVSRTFGLDRGQPIDRYYIERFLARERAVIRGTVLEVAESRYTDQFGSDVLARRRLVTVGSGAPEELVADLTRPDELPQGVFDCFICTQTLNFIDDVHGAVEGIAALLRPGGVALVTVAGISQISRYDMDRWGDYWRFTMASMNALFRRFPGEVELASYGNLAAAMALLQGIAVEDLADSSLLDPVDEDYQVVLCLKATRG